MREIFHKLYIRLLDRLMFNNREEVVAAYSLALQGRWETRELKKGYRKQERDEPIPNPSFDLKPFMRERPILTLRFRAPLTLRSIQTHFLLPVKSFYVPLRLESCSMKHMLQTRKTMKVIRSRRPIKSIWLILSKC
jgi:hypothetical protein